jgi:hypothetical protein
MKQEHVSIVISNPEGGEKSFKASIKNFSVAALHRNDIDEARMYKVAFYVPPQRDRGACQILDTL